MRRKKTITACIGLLLAALCALAGCGSAGAGSASNGAAGSAPPVAAAPPAPTASPSPTPEPTPEPTPAPTEDPAAALAEALLSNMTSEEKVGQLILARCPRENAAAEFAAYRLGGVVLFGVDFENKTKDQVVSDIRALQDAASLPLLVAVDEEGGAVNRVSRNSLLRDSPFLSPRALYQSGGWDAIMADTAEKCALLSDLGINLNLAPVCDLSSEGSFMYPRSFGPDAALTAEYVRAVVSAMWENGMGSCLKHFPGYGDNGDTHTGSAYDDRGLDTFRGADFLPFEAGIEAGAGAVMVCHNVVACMDDTAPASLSAEVHRALRETLGFEGVVMTDDLSMDAVTEFSRQSGASAAVLAVLAGNDVLCCTDYAGASAELLAALEDGTLTEARLDESVLRVLAWKISLGIIEG